MSLRIVLEVTIFYMMILYMVICFNQKKCDSAYVSIALQFRHLKNQVGMFPQNDTHNLFLVYFLCNHLAYLKRSIDNFE